MAKRKIKDAKDISSGELIYFKGHAKATFMSNGETVEDGKQDRLISGSNIKTINGTSLLGEGNIVINSGESEDIYRLVIDTVNLDDSTKTASGSVSAEELEKIFRCKILSLYVCNNENALGLEIIFAQLSVKSDHSGFLNMIFSSISEDIFSSSRSMSNLTLEFNRNDDGGADWLLCSLPVLKTINGESLLGEGDITISVNEEDLAGILDRVSENEKVTASALNELRENLNNIDIPVATTDTIGGVKLGTQLAGYLDMVCLAGDSVGNVGININSYDFSITGEEKLGIRKSRFYGHNEDKQYQIAPFSFGTPVVQNWSATSLGVPVDSDYFTLNERGLTIKEGSVSDIKVTWDANSNMNDFKTPGVYEIYGERTVKTDNLPITNDGSGNSFAAKLTVVASTLQPANNEICITQFLQLSNRIGGEGTTYVRTYNENNNGMNGWSPWQKQMGMVETLINSNNVTVGQEIFSGETQKIGDGIDGMIDNGMYSGIYVDTIIECDPSLNLYCLYAQPTFVETFVLVVINDYAASGKLNLSRHITQLKYAVDSITGQSTVKKRVGTGNDTISWGDWENIDDSLVLGSGLQYGVSGELYLRLGNGLCFSGEGIDKFNLDVKLIDESTVNEPGNFIPVSYGYGPSRNSGLGVLLSDDFTVSIYDGHFRLGLSNAISSHGYEEITLGSNVTSKTIDPNTYYIWENEMSNLTVSLGPTILGVTNEYSFQFTSGSTPTVLTLPSDIKWVDGKSPEIEANCTYQVSILNNLGVCVKFC